MDLDVGDRVIVELSTFEDRFLGEVSAIDQNGGLLVRVGLPTLATQRVQGQCPATVRYAYDGRLLGFGTTVVSVRENSACTLEFAPPGRVFEAEDRCEPRCSCLLPAVVTEGDTAAKAVVENLSASCARVRFLNGGICDFPEELDRAVNLWFDDLGSHGEYVVNCRVIKAFMKNDVRFAVLRFKRDEPDVLKDIAGFMETRVCCVIPRTQ